MSDNYIKNNLNILDIAKTFLGLENNLDCWKLQQICYYSQAWYLTLNDEVLFNDDLFVNKNGVYCSLIEENYNTLKSQNKIPNKIINNTYLLSHLKLILNQYKNLNNKELKKLILSEKPWQLSFKTNNKKILISSLKSYYSQLITI